MKAGGGLPIAPWAAGALIAIVAVVAGAFLVTDPPAYGLCVACQSRDLVGGVLNPALGLDLPVAWSAGGWPALTAVGLLIGAFLGARGSGEWHAQPARHPLRQFLLGVLAMCLGLLALGCMTRLLLRAAYGDTLAYWAVGGVALGICLATGLLAWRARR